MCVLSDVTLSGLFLTSNITLPNSVFVTRGAMSEMALVLRLSVSKLVNPTSADTSETLLL